ncbi:MAG: extracellular solute-binding protein [Acidimicrobiia bacterium]
MVSRARVWALLGAFALLVTACTGEGSGTLTVYTSVTQATVDAVVAGFEEANPETSVEVFRAPTGEVAARLEADRRSGSPSADVLWLSDPLSMYQYRADGLLASWGPAGAEALPAAAVADTFWGTRVLHLVMVVTAGNPHGLASWRDLEDPSLAVALPDPRFAGSAFAALGYFGLEPGFGLDFYAELKDAGAVQVASPGDVVTGVAEGRFDAGLTLEFSARSAVGKGSPIEVVWPAPAAVAVTSPIAVLAAADPAEESRSFVDHVLSPVGQAAVGATGWTPVLPGVAGPAPPAGTPVVFPDWAVIYERQSDLLAGYTEVFDG